MFERFTDRARRVVVLAQEEARLLGHAYIGTEHLLLGLIAEGDGVGAKALEQLGVELHKVRAEVERIIGKGGAVPAGHIPFTPRAKQVLELSLRESLHLRHNYIGTEHVLLGLLAEGEGVAAQILVRLGLTPDGIRATVLELLGQPEATVPPLRPRATVRDDLSPGLRHALEAAESLAGPDGTVGSHHVLAVFSLWNDLAAYDVLAAGGFDASRLDVAIHEWDIAGTRDETPEQWGARVTTITTEEGAVVIRLTDVALRSQIEAALEQGLGPQVQRDLGRFLQHLRVVRGSVGEAGDAAEAPAAGGDEHDEEQGGADEDDGGA